MRCRFRKCLAVVVVGGLTTIVGAATGSAQERKAGAAKQSSGWTIPPDAADKKNPLTVDEEVLAQGKAVFKEKCQKCHGPTGVGDGPDADPDVQEDMDLTNPKRAERNSDGVVFYKVSNGRRKPKMPTFKDELSEQQIWQVVSYVQTLRKKQ